MQVGRGETTSALTSGPIQPSSRAPIEPTEALAASRDKRAAMPSSNPDAAERIAALKRREASSGPRWFGVPLEDMQTASDMGFTVPLFLRALRQALYAQDVFETPGCFQHTHRCNQKAKNALRERLAGGEDPFVVCKPSVPVELLTSLLIDWLHELPGGFWGEELASGWPLIACTSPSRRKGAPGKGRTNLMQLMAKTLGGTDDMTLIWSHAWAIAPCTRATAERGACCSVCASHSSRQPHTSISNRYCSGCSRCWTWRSSIKSTREWATPSSLRWRPHCTRIVGSHRTRATPLISGLECTWFPGKAWTSSRQNIFARSVVHAPTRPLPQPAHRQHGMTA